MFIGRIKEFHSRRGTGSIELDGLRGDAPDIVFSITRVVDHPRVVQEGDIVAFTLELNERNQLEATEIHRSREVRISDWAVCGLLIERAKSRDIATKALIAEKSRDFDTARSLYQTAIDMSPDVTYYRALAEMERHRGNADAARDVYRQMLAYQPRDTDGIQQLVELERAAGDLKAAVMVLRSGLLAVGDDAALRGRLAVPMITLGEQLTDRTLLTDAEKLFKWPDCISDHYYQQLAILRQPRSQVLWKMLKDLSFKVLRLHVQFLERRGEAKYAIITVQSPDNGYFQGYNLNAPLLIYCPFTSSPTKTHVMEGIELLTQQTAAEITKDVMIIFLSTMPPELVQDLMTLRENPEKYPAIIPLEERRVLKLETTIELQGYLKSTLNEWLLRRDTYRQLLPVAGRNFFGRERELGYLSKCIDDGQHVGLFGLRKVGKTSILRQLQEIKTTHTIAYVNLQAASIRDCRYPCWETIREVYHRRPASGVSLLLANPKYRSMANLPDFDATLSMFDQDIDMLISGMEETSKLVIMIDEIDEIMPKPGLREGFAHYFQFIRYLRGKSQQVNGRLVLIATAANAFLCEQARWDGQENPFFLFLDEVYLPLLEQSDCNTMVVQLGRRMGVQFDEEALECLYRATGGHPAITRVFCSRLVGDYTGRPLRVTEAMVVRTEGEFLIWEDRLFREIVIRLRDDFPDDLAFLDALVAGYDPEEIKLLIQNWHVSLKHLVGYQLLRHDLTDASYSIKMGLFERWLRTRR